MRKAVLLFALSGLVALYAACGAGASPEAQIQTTFDDFIKAASAGDMDKMKALVAKDSIEEIAGSEQQVQMMAEFMKTMKFELSEIKVEGETASGTVTITGSFMGQEMNDSGPASFKFEDGKWKIANLKEE